jgi:hypothetical protein
VSDDLEQRLREYGSTVDTATAADLAEREEHVVEASVQHMDRHPRRTVAIIAVVAIAAVAAVGVVTISHRSHATVDAPSSPVPSSRSCSSGALTVTQRFVCKRLRHPHGYQPQYNDLGSGTDGYPTPAQAATLAVELRQYDPATVQAMIKKAERNGNHPTDQALVSALEFQNACRQTLIAATAAESVPADKVASVVNGIINPEITRLRARSVSDDTGYEVFQHFARQLIAGHAPQVLLHLRDPRLPKGTC